MHTKCDIQTNQNAADHVLIADEYHNAPLVDPAALYSWASLARDVGRLYQYVLRQGVVMHSISKGRYQSFSEICKDIRQGRIIRPMDFYPHPVFDLETQAMFRVVHDYFHYETQLDFTVESEKWICERHHRTAFSPASYPAIVVEIYGQAAYGVVYGKDPANKVFIPQMAKAEHEQHCRYCQHTWDYTKPELNRVLQIEQWTTT